MNVTGDSTFVNVYSTYLHLFLFYIVLLICCKFLAVEVTLLKTTRVRLSENIQGNLKAIDRQNL